MLIGIDRFFLALFKASFLVYKASIRYEFKLFYLFPFLDALFGSLLYVDGLLAVTLMGFKLGLSSKVSVKPVGVNGLLAQLLINEIRPVLCKILGPH